MIKRGWVVLAFLLSGVRACLGEASTPAAAESAAKLERILAADWAEHDLKPAPPAGDAAFLRRVWLDLAGQTVPVDRIREFVVDRSPGKRAAMVDALLASDEFAEHWGGLLAEWTLGRRPRYEERFDGRVLQQWLKQELLANRSYDTVVRALVTGEGAKDRSGPATFLLRYEARPAELTGAIGRELLGVSLQCAQCHEHPTAHWSQADFWGVAACFGRLHVLTGDANGQPLTAVYETRRGELERPDDKAEPGEDGQRPQHRVAPRLPDGTRPPSGERRAALAAWLTADDNPYLARNAVNRLWQQLFGQRLLRSLDPSEPAHAAGFRERMLDELAADFRASGYDLKRCLRAVVLSRPYQLAAGDGAESPLSADPAARAARLMRLDHFAMFPVRPVDVDVLYRSIVRATGYVGHEEPPMNEASEEGLASPAALATMPLVSDVSAATTKRQTEKAARMGAPAVAVEGDDDQSIPTEPNDWPAELLGERGLTVQRSLALLNSEYLREAVRSGARLAQANQPGRANDGQIEWLFLATLSRRPTADELAAMKGLCKGRGAAGLEDVLWALFNSAEFATNH